MSRRAMAAQETRARVIEAARTGFLRDGYAATTIRRVAEQAGVSQETVYKSFGGKAGLLKAVYDVAIAGDADDRPIAERPEAIAAREAATPAAAAVAYAAFARTLTDRIGPLLHTVLAARGTSAEVAAFAEVIDGERLVGARMAVDRWAERGWLQPDVTTERGADVVWMLNSWAVRQLAGERGWTDADYDAWLAESLLRQVLDGG